MAARTKHNAGFTLAELLLVVAIILVLGALAAPSIITAQNNMRMMELNNAAESIANAAQTQMTAKKVDGTWLSTIEKGGSGADAKNVKYPRAKNLPADMPSDTYYMTAAEARNSGIVPSLSVDDSVRNGDYIIEFTASTANVVSVFYTDGKSGFFGSAPASTDAAQRYYAGENLRDQAARMANNPMIGYYQGTPTGATNAVALRNPVVYVNETTGCLMIQDPNIADNGSAGTTTSTVRIENTTVKEGVSTKLVFVLSSLSNATSLMYVATEDGGTEFSLSGSELEDVMKQVDRNGTGNGNVFSIDLNALSRKVAAANDSKADLKNVFANCLSDDDLTVTVETKDTSTPSVPATARANIKWPAPVGKFTLLVTNPYSTIVAGSVNDAYKVPTVRAATDKHAEAVGVRMSELSEDKDNYLRDTTVNQNLVNQNPQAGYQSYTGGWVASSDVQNDSTFRFEAKTGSFNTHTYQIWEIWIKRSDNGDIMRVGYLNNNQWEWAKFSQDEIKFDFSFLDKCISWYAKGSNELHEGLAGRDTDTLNIETLAIDAQKVFADGVAQKMVDADNNVTLYVRTAPKASEVQAYFNDLASENTLVSNYLTRNTDETGSRKNMPASADARSAFEAEFGASSSDVSWVVSKERKTGFSQGNAYVQDEACQNVRVYYSIAPGVGFGNIRGYNGGKNNEYLTGVRSTRMTNVSLWLYRGASFDALQIMPSATSLYLENDPYTCASTANCDFMLTPYKDHLFYRVLTYEGVQSGSVAAQYVPHVSAGQSDIATIAFAENYEDDDYIYTFTGWTTSNVTTGDSAMLQGGHTLAEYTTLSYQGVTLTANYDKKEKVKPSLGLMYIETGIDSNDAVKYGYYGYINGNEEPVGEETLLSNDYTLSDGGYYVVVPAGSNRPVISDRDDIPDYVGDFSDTLQDISIEGGLYDCYRLKVSDKDVGSNRPYDNYKKRNYKMSFKADIPSGSKTVTVEGTYIMNFAFACAIETNENAAAQWGKSENSSWNVRLGRQFIGCLTGGSNNVQVTYASDNYFTQTHDIDMADAPVNGVSRFSHVFSGSTYDGGNNAVYGLQSRLQNGSITGENGGTNGLFLNVSNGSTLKYIRIVLDATAEDESYRVESTNYNMKFGLLAGNILNSFVESCKVEVRGGEKSNLTVVKTSEGDNGLYFGGLFGYSDGTTIANCSFANVHLILSNNNRDWKSILCIGMIIGYIDNSSNISYGVFADSAVDVTSKSNSKIYFGGVAGYVKNFLQAANCSFTNVSLYVLADQGMDKVIAGVSGGTAAIKTGIANNTASNMNVIVRNVLTRPIENSWGV